MQNGPPVQGSVIHKTCGEAEKEQMLSADSPWVLHALYTNKNCVVAVFRRTTMINQGEHMFLFYEGT